MTVKNESECFLSFSHTLLRVINTCGESGCCCRGPEDQQRWQRRARRGWEPKWGIKCSFLNLLFCKTRRFSRKNTSFRFPKENAGNFLSFRFYNLKSQKERQSFCCSLCQDIIFSCSKFRERKKREDDDDGKVRKRFLENVLIPISFCFRKRIYISRNLFAFESLMSIIDFFTISSLFLFLLKRKKKKEEEEREERRRWRKRGNKLPTPEIKSVMSFESENVPIILRGDHHFARRSLFVARSPKTQSFIPSFFLDTFDTSSRKGFSRMKPSDHSSIFFFPHFSHLFPYFATILTMINRKWRRSDVSVCVCVCVWVCVCECVCVSVKE